LLKFSGMKSRVLPTVILDDLEAVAGGGGGAPAGSMSPVREGLYEYLGRAGAFEDCLGSAAARSPIAQPFLFWRCHGILKPS
jgi:hypothetical protein